MSNAWMNKYNILQKIQKLLPLKSCKKPTVKLNLSLTDLTST